MPPLERPTRPMVDSMTHFITITLAPKCYKWETLKQFKNSFSIVQKLLEQWTDRYFIVAELTEDSNIHYHGLLKFRMDDDDLTQHHFNNAYKKIKRLGFKKLELVKSLDYAFKYCIGDNIKMKKDELLKTYKFLNHGKSLADAVQPWKYWVKPQIEVVESVFPTILLDKIVQEKPKVETIDEFEDFDKLFVKPAKPMDEERYKPANDLLPKTRRKKVVPEEVKRLLEFSRKQ